MDWTYWIKVAVIIVSVYVISYILRKLLGLYIKKNSVKVNVDPTNFSFLKNSLTFVLYAAGLIAIFYITPSLKSFGKALFAGAGVLAAVIGFASQKAFSNIICGIFILIFRPFRVKDVIEVANSYRGVVEEITLRHTIIRNYENRRIIIPNSIIDDETIVNSNIIEEKVLKFVEFDISYESNADLAKQIISEEAKNHPLSIDNRTENEKHSDAPMILLRIIALGDFSVKIRAYVWCKNHHEAFILTCDLYESVKKRFDKEGIEIPYPHRTIVDKKNKTA